VCVCYTITVSRACDMSPCLNDGTCNQDPLNVTKFTCTCFNRYSGDRCEISLLANTYTRTHIYTQMCFAAQTPPMAPNLNCTTVLGSTFKGNATIAPVSCYNFISTSNTAQAALTACGALRTDTIKQRYRLAWPTSFEVFTYLRSMITSVC
jgi:hypothetical protein